MRQATYLRLLEEVVSRSRLRAYRLTAMDRDLEVHARYAWNVALCEALYPALEGVEIALRNSLHEAASTAFGTDLWFALQLPNGQRVLQPNELRRFATAASDLRGRFAATGRVVAAGDIVAELTFGLWVHLFHAPYEHPSLFWPRHLAAVFPFAPRRQRTRRGLLARLDALRRLRNRTFHHEPIWNRSSLAADHAVLLETIRWISPAQEARVRAFDRFPAVYDDGPVPFEAGLTAPIGTLPP